MASINDIQDAVVEEFSFFSDWMDKYEYLIDLGKNLPLIDEQWRDDDHLVKGCQSRVWLHAREAEDGKVHFTADSDAVITKGIIALLVRVLSGHSAQDIQASDLYFIDQIGLREHLSPNRSNGLVSMVKQMKYYALAFAAQKKTN